MTKINQKPQRSVSIKKLDFQGHIVSLTLPPPPLCLIEDFFFIYFHTNCTEKWLKTKTKKLAGGGTIPPPMDISPKKN